MVNENTPGIVFEMQPGVHCHIVSYLYQVEMEVILSISGLPSTSHWKTILQSYSGVAGSSFVIGISRIYPLTYVQTDS